MERKRSNPTPKIKKSQKLRNSISSFWKNHTFAIIIAAILVMTGTAAVISIASGPNNDCPPHTHSAYSVWLEDERVPFRHPDFFEPSSSIAAGTHIHYDDGVYHWHATGAKCHSLKDGLRNLEVTIKGSTLTLGEEHGANAGTYKSENDAQLQIFVQRWSEQDANWTKVTDVKELLEKQPKDGDGVVIIWGHQSEAEIQEILKFAPSMIDTNYDPHQ